MPTITETALAAYRGTKPVDLGSWLRRAYGRGWAIYYGAEGYVSAAPTYNGGGRWTIEQPCHGAPVTLVRMTCTTCGRPYVANLDTDDFQNRWVNLGRAISIVTDATEGCDHAPVDHEPF